jgi:excisionase family DNA binding protein
MRKSGVVKGDFMSQAHSVPECAEFLNCSIKFLKDEIDRGNLRARKIGERFIRILPRDLQEWLDKGDTIGRQEVEVAR